MTPISPVIPFGNYEETVYGKNQKEYRPLPVVKAEDGTVISRWRLTWKERFMALVTGDIYLLVKTCHHPLQPINMTTKVKDWVS